MAKEIEFIVEKSDKLERQVIINRAKEFSIERQCNKYLKLFEILTK